MNSSINQPNLPESFYSLFPHYNEHIRAFAKCYGYGKPACTDPDRVIRWVLQEGGSFERVATPYVEGDREASAYYAQYRDAKYAREEAKSIIEDLSIEKCSRALQLLQQLNNE